MSTHKDTGKHNGRHHADAHPGETAKRPVVPAVPSESGVGEEDPGDFENASIHPDDGKHPAGSPHKAGK
ncbi:hypothetical protein ACS7SF_13435 [Ralstonia sp. 25C]|uniref:hypothetical protein n=1 Tax=Ralstonia sp. 25C TaxID=3447363 RepID=UPI003F74E96F